MPQQAEATQSAPDDAQTPPVKRQWQIFLVALAFFTRIPIPAKTPYSSERLNQANRYFGAVGIVVGGIAAAVYLVAQWAFTPPIAVGLAIVVTLLLTGAFHEDGLADVFDGFGGGWTPAQKLDIMKDSRLGAYGAAALFMMLGLKWATLSALAEDQPLYPALALLVLHPLSRICAASLIFSYPYVRADALSKVKPLANQQSQQDLWVLITTGLIILLLLPLSSALALVVVIALVRWGCGLWFHRQLGGYTGDCLGAAQQISELAGYLVLLALM
ncbi:adenosylcobinamide-GDP ribazoletransferase [Photobacterium sp. TY1-4]|uniref:adenosylcobinamide-GDP ribazoletransferase n=1 Tax=Photobacterium sp. TY1-4 TaxID=2899122 RepID=UPI0021BEEEFE|nr:adenosylcobinamide-GDP ribazoletransferase [Photobacterium sp. TY1-4]UXI02885.1 adenosylcobinamide-GDP ribazoletransferase [Photobacterium sp. TY1-4]